MRNRNKNFGFKRIGCPTTSAIARQIGLFGPAQAASAALGCPAAFQEAAQIQFLPERGAEQGEEAGETVVPASQPGAEVGLSRFDEPGGRGAKPKPTCPNRPSLKRPSRPRRPRVAKANATTKPSNAKPWRTGLDLLRPVRHPDRPRPGGVFPPASRTGNAATGGDATPQRADLESENRALRAELARVREQRDILKKSGHPLRTIEDRCPAVQALKTEHPLA